MTRKKRRLYMVLGGMATLGVAAALILTAFQDNIVLFCSPTDIQNKATCAKADIRLGRAGRRRVGLCAAKMV